MAEIENTTIESKARNAVGQALQGQLVDLVDLSLLAKQLHWNVVGPNFRSVHLQLDDVVTFAREQADVMAERAVALAVNPDGQTRTVTDCTPIKPVEVGWLRDHEVVSKMTEVLSELIRRCRERIEATDEPDPATQDLIIAVCQGLEEQHWMFQAQV
jgi:starvation-inducible DNA-binding protein